MFQNSELRTQIHLFDIKIKTNLDNVLIDITT